MKNIFILLIILLLFSGSLAARGKRADEFPVLSYNNLECRDFNRKISAAAQTGESWVLRPLSIVQRYRSIADTAFVSLCMHKDKAECASRAIVTLVEEGYLDDVLRGQWFQFHLSRADCRSAWKIEEIRQAYLCGRMGSPNEFSKELCP